MYIKNKRGQSTVEYILLVTAVVAVMIAFVTTKQGGFQSQLNTTLNTATADGGDMAGRLSASHAASTSPTGSNVGVPPYSLPVAPSGADSGGGSNATDAT